MRYIFLSVALVWQVFAVAQKTIDVSKNEGIGANTFYSVGGAPFVNAKFVRLISGSPFFKEQWMKGSGTAANGTAYGGGLVKLNLYDNDVIFLNAAGIEMIATTPLKEIILTDTINNLSYHFENSLPWAEQNKKRWLQRLATGKAALYKAYNKVINENVSYGNATTEQTMNTIELFYVLQNNELKPVKKPKDVISLLTDKQAELNAYFNKKEFPKGNAEQQMLVLVTYYNSLQ
jgi:hypothetical protein